MDIQTDFFSFCTGDAHVQFASAGGIIAASDTSRECIEGDATTHVFLLYDFCNFPARTIGAHDRFENYCKGW